MRKPAFYIILYIVLGAFLDYFSSVWEQPVCKTLADNHFWEKIPSVAAAEEELLDIYASMKAEHDDEFDCQ